MFICTPNISGLELVTKTHTKHKISDDVAVIDEIQMIKDPQRGWAWTRAFLGLCARELHVCGEAAAIPLIQELALLTGEEVEVREDTFF